MECTALFVKIGREANEVNSVVHNYHEGSKASV